MHSVVRSVLAVAAGLATALILVVGVEAVSSKMYPLPPGVDQGNPESLAAAIARLPVGALLGVLVAWGLGAFGGAFTAARLGSRRPLGLLVGTLLLVAAVGNMLAIPHPIWFWFAAFVVIPATTMAGVRLVPRDGAR
jgi:hypothetical protein